MYHPNLLETRGAAAPQQHGRSERERERMSHFLKTRFSVSCDIVGGLSNPSKMPCYSTSLPATECKTGSELARIEGSVCHGCYAREGCYLFASTREAMARRLASLSHPDWVPAMAALAAAWANTRSMLACTG